MTVETSLPSGAAAAAAVALRTGRLKLLGGPGAGKTAALAARRTALIRDGVAPDRILFFSAGRARAQGATARPFAAYAWDLVTGEFRVLTQDGTTVVRGYELAGLPAPPVLLGRAGARAVVARLLAGADPRAWPAHGPRLGSKAFARRVAAFVVGAQRHLYDPADVERSGRRDGPELGAFLRLYLRTLATGAGSGDGRPRLDVASVVAEACRILIEHPAVAMDVRALHPHVIVDDLHLASPLDLALLAEIATAGDGGSAVVAGDPGAGGVALARFDAPALALGDPAPRA